MKRTRMISEPPPFMTLSPLNVAKRHEFDKAYYQRFYGYPRIRANDAREIALLGDFVCAYLRYLGQPVRRVLDIGCGLGSWQDVVARHHPRASYTGVEANDFLCERHGWIIGSVVDFKARGAFDLVICKDVLQYLPHAAASTAIERPPTTKSTCAAATGIGGDFGDTSSRWGEACSSAAGLQASCGSWRSSTELIGTLRASSRFACRSRRASTEDMRTSDAV